MSVKTLLLGSFQHKVKEINEQLTFKMGVKSAASQCLRETFLGIVYEIMSKSAGTKLQ